MVEELPVARSSPGVVSGTSSAAEGRPMLHPNPLFAAIAAPPIAEAQGWVRGRTFPAEKPLIDVAQAVPGYPPAPALVEHLARRLADPLVHRYTEVPGLPALREAFAGHLTAFYGAPVAAGQVTVTAGCNQAFCLAMMTLARAGDEVILPLPFYFNHKMWLDMLGVRAVHLAFRPETGGVPDPEEAAAGITDRTRAIVLVTPNNPTGAICPPAVLRRFYALAKARGLALVLDETYKDFRQADGPPHDLLSDPDWPDTLVQLHSFSKVFCLTGHRVGAIVCGPALRAEIVKALDCVAICAPRLGQEAALFGLTELADWRRANTAMMRERVATFRNLFRGNSGWRPVSVGAYFAYVEHPFGNRPAFEVARGLAERQNLLTLPGPMFGPGQERYLRFAFANVAAETMPAIAARLAESLAER